ncbi:MAG: sigma 54-interacting transcriptional regulator [Pseudomonadota bacterium]
MKDMEKEENLLTVCLDSRMAELDGAITVPDSGRSLLSPAAITEERVVDPLPYALCRVDVSHLRKRAAGLREEGVADFRDYVAKHPDFINEAARIMRVTYANADAVRLFGAVSMTGVLGSFARLTAPGAAEAITELVVSVVERAGSLAVEAPVMTVEGEIRHCLMKATSAGAGFSAGDVWIAFVDITDRRKAEDELRRNEERYRAIFCAAPDCIYVKDRKLKFVLVNPAMERLVGRDAASLIGRSSSDIFGEEAGEHVAEVDIRVLAGESVEEEHTRPVNGEPITFHDIKVPLRNTDGAIFGVCGISRDITERKRFGRFVASAPREYPSNAMRETLARSRYVAETESVVLLQGESGSGKDYLARYIHLNSRRNKGPFFGINCAALSHELAESELFGHESGAFTGARARKRGLTELAEGGTLLLNEIGELPLTMQSKLLTFLDTRSFTRVGGEKTIHIDARIVAATHRDLKTEVAEGRFLQALFYRLDVFSIEVPPLRERLEDLPILVGELIAKLAADMNITQIVRPDRKAMASITKHHWPGNVRELKNALERGLILQDWDHLEHSYTPVADVATEDWCVDLRFPSDLTIQGIRDQVTQAVCLEALRRSRGNKKMAAEFLGVSRFSFYRYLNYFSIRTDDVTET